MISEIEALTVRVARLERTNGRLKLAAAGLLLALMALVSMGFAGKPRTIEAEKLVIRDSHGRARIMIGTPEVAGVAIDLKPDTPAIWLSDEGGTDRAILTTDGVYLANGHGKPIAELMDGTSGPQLRLHGSDGKVIWSAR